MKSKFKVQMAIQVFFAATILIAITVFASQPGTNDDPLVSKSYVDNKINQVLNNLNSGNTGNNNTMTSQGITENEKKQIIDQVMKEVEPLIALMMENYSKANNTNNENSNTAPTTPNNNMIYTSVYVATGQVVLGSDGTEMILRSGKATAYVTGVAGIVNATSGTELKNNAKINLNNILIIPRGDGRGVKVTENAWFMIKGEYKISD